MEILELHLRNIASIMEADIDFTKDLRDGVTGDPASLFLICGDTGTGKSVILDGIAMALYKTTPRITGVVNVNNNKFKGKEGGDVSINDIRQYTRIGISHKDKCYSEVVFRGNDGIIYHARLSLGFTRNRTYSQVVWEVKKGEADWISRDRDCKEMIQKAIGLSFEQFCRMAMLAQGQFATFLKGKREERTAILEQLTNTERFSTYGRAITSIFQKAREEKNGKQLLYDNEVGRLMPEEELQEQIDEKEVFLKQKSFAEASVRLANERLNQLRQLIEHQTKLTNTESEMKQAEERQQGEEYQNAVAVITNFESTIEERSHLKALINTRKELEKTKIKSQTQAALFLQLTTDIHYRNNQLQQLREALRQQAEWLASQASRTDLYARAGAIEEQLKQFKLLNDDIDDKHYKLQKAQEKTPTLHAAVETDKAILEEADKALKAHEAVIEAQKEKLSAYDLAKISSSVKEAAERKNKLTHLEEGVVKLFKEQEELEKLSDEIAHYKAALVGLKADRDAKTEAYKAASDAYDEANSQLTTMKQSVDKMLVALRAKIVKESIDTCPLCGQHIATHIDSTDFKQILAQWEEKEAAARKNRDEAQAASRQADKAYNKRSAEIEEKEKNNYNRRMKTAQETEAMLKSHSTDLGLVFDTTLSTQIAAELERSATDIRQLTDQQTTAISIQNHLNQLIEEKKPLDKAQKDAEKKLTKINQKVRENQQEISSFQSQLKENEAKKAETTESLSSVLSEFYPNWESNPLETRNSLHNDCAAYQQKQRNYDNDRHLEQEQTTLMEQLQTSCQSMTDSHPEWAVSEDAQAFACANILKEWQIFSNGVAATDNALHTLKKSEDEHRQAIVESGKTEEELAAIEASEKLYEPSKKLVKEVTEKLTSLQGSVSTLTQEVESDKKKLGIESEPVEAANEEEAGHATDYTTLLPAYTAIKDKADKQLAEIQNAITTIGNILEGQSKNREKLAIYQSQLEVATARLHHWDLLNKHFGGDRFRNLVQTYVLRPLLNNANAYLQRITDRYELTCDEQNEQLSIFVLDRYNKNQMRSATVLSGGETFMISLALSLSLSSLNAQGMNVNILFIDEGFGTLDEKTLDNVMSTLEKLQDIAGQSHRRVGIISHREELQDRIPAKIRVEKRGEGRSQVVIHNE